MTGRMKKGERGMVRYVLRKGRGMESRGWEGRE